MVADISIQVGNLNTSQKLDYSKFDTKNIVPKVCNQYSIGSDFIKTSQSTGLSKTRYLSPLVGGKSSPREGNRP